ncbi:hypothetical protein B0T22DRAFT_154029 [Podospora appendiculata]|uniref:Secreted protein n=1 Tax=Podospora appendiculata TaxID=314037 RepID=A0AAE0X9A6_9PEZI|nr:hypothetical protein B0T22DRAFT_154029 [Podospora appendiculata]
MECTRCCNMWFWGMCSCLGQFSVHAVPRPTNEGRGTKLATMFDCSSSNFMGYLRAYPGRLGTNQGSYSAVHTDCLPTEHRLHGSK